MLASEPVTTLGGGNYRFYMDASKFRIQGDGVVTIAIAAGAPMQLGATGSYLVIEGAVHSLAPGDVVPLTFEFSNAPPVVVRASVTNSGC